MPDDNSVTITGPDGQDYQFPSGTDKNAAIAYFKAKGIGVSKNASQASPRAGTAISTPDQLLSSAGIPTSGKIAQFAKDLPTGIAEGAANTVGNSITGIAGLLNKIPYVGQYLAPKEGVNALQQRVDQQSTPQSSGETVGKTGEQIGEWLLPTGLEEKAVASLPKAAKVAAPLVRMGVTAGESAIRNASQGGSAVQGAEAGLAGGAVGEAARAIAPKLAETSLAIPSKMRGRGRDIGNAILDETNGFRPVTLAAETKSKIADLTAQLNTAANSSNIPASTTPALQIISDAVTKAAKQNDGAAIEKLTKVWDQLTKEYGTNNPIPATVSAERLLNLKRGLGSMISSWNPVDRKAVDTVVKKVYGALDAELDRTVPEAADINQKISSLIPANQRARIMSNRAGIVQNSLGRVAAHTGALAGAGIGGTLGYRENGIPGAIAGSAAGLAIPEIATNPATIMAAARAAKSSVPKRLLIGSALQATRKNNVDPDSQAINDAHENIQDFINSLPQ